MVGETNAFGNAYFVDQTQGLYYWNGTSTTYVANTPKGSIITQFHNRLWVTGAAVPNGNQLYGSAYYGGNTWTTGLNDTDPVQYSIGLQDNFDNVTAEYVYLDTLYLFKHYSVFALYGFGQSSFQISQLTQECGCIDGATIQTYNGGLKFVSLRGVEDFNGYSCKRISDPVKNKVDPAIQLGGFSQQSWVQSTAIDWNAGTLDRTMTTRFPGNLSLDGLSDDFSTLSNWTTGAGSLNLSANTVYPTANSGTNSLYSADMVGFKNEFQMQFSYQFTSGGNVSGLDFYSDISNSSSSIVGTGVSISGDFPNTTYGIAIDAHGLFNRHSVVHFSADTLLHTAVLTRSSTGFLTLYVDGVSTATYTDTDNLPLLKTMRLNWAANNSVATLKISTFGITASSGTFKSQIHSIGTMSSWGNFPVQESLNGGNIDFSVCSSTNSDMSAPTSCASQVPNSQISVSTGSYVQWYATFTVTSATSAPTLQSGTVQWFTGSAQVPMASTVWDNRYWLSLTTTTADSSNDAVLVLNKSGAWAPFDIHAGAFTQFKNSLYHADSQATGNIYLDNQGWADNGNPIRAYVHTKDLPLGDFSTDDYLFALYPTAMNSGPCNMSVNYDVDGNSTQYSLGNINLNEYASMTAVRLPFPVDSTHQDFGQSMSMTFGTNDASCGWQFLGLEGLYKSRPNQ
jgi:hypothetical protein